MGLLNNLNIDNYDYRQDVLQDDWQSSLLYQTQELWWVQEESDQVFEEEVVPWKSQDSVWDVGVV